MNTLDVSQWLWDFYLLATVLLVLVLVAGQCLKQPARRMALAWATTVGLLALAVFIALPNWSQLHLSTPAPPAPEWIEDLQPVFGQAIQQTPVIPAAPAQDLPPGMFPTATQIVVIDWGVIALYTLTLGSLVVMLWLALGAWQVRRLRANAERAPDEIVKTFDQLAQGESQSVQLGVLRNLPVAVAVGLRKPWILLPQSLVANANREHIRSVLAHELAHVAHRDLWLLALLRGLMVLLWPHPLFWLLRRRVRLDQEILADAAAAQLTSRGEYAEQLVALARTAVEIRVPRLASSVGLWEKPSQLKRRIALLLDEKLTVLRICSGRWRVGTLVALLSVAVGLSLVTLTPAETEEAQAAEKSIAGGEEVGTLTNDDFRAMEVRITDEEGQPLDGAKLYIGVWYTKGYEGEKVPKEYFADSQGVVNLKLPRRLHILRLWPSKPGYVPEFTNFTGGSHEEGRLIPDRYEFQLARGTTLGGIIVDEEGAPVSGVKVDVRVQADEPPVWGVNPEPMISAWLTDEDFQEGSAITDKDGKWDIDNAPTQTDKKDFEFRLKITHPDFASDTKFGELQGKQQIATAALRNGTAKIVLSRGRRVRGVVVNSVGEPVTDGYVVWGNSLHSGDAKKLETQLDDAGSFITSPLSRGEHAITVIAPGYMPEQRTVNVESSMDDLRFELRPGKRLVVKVVDREGKPIPQAYFHVGSWSGVEEEFYGSQSSILHSRIPKNAGQDGVYVWDGAPTDAITFQISARDFAAKRITLTATGGEHVVELVPALIVFGKVTDAKTGEPIETFNAVPLLVNNFGLISSTWQHGTVTGENGLYEIRLDGISDFYRDYKIRFEAKGYHTLFSEKTFNLSDGRVEYDVTLTPAEPPAEIDNTKANSSSAINSLGKNTNSEQKQIAESQQEDPLKKVLEVLHAASKPNAIVGICLDENGQPLAGVNVAVYVTRPGSKQAHWGHIGTTDAQGRFQFDEVIDIAKEFPEGLPDQNFVPRGSPIVTVVAQTFGRVPGLGNELAFQIARRGKVELFKMAPAVSLQGHVVDDQRRAVVGARVSTGHWASTPGVSDDVNAAATDEQGAFTINDLDSYDAVQAEKNFLESQQGVWATHVDGGQPWERFLQVRHPDYAAKRVKITQIPGSVDITLSPGAVLTGRVVTQEADKPSQPAADVEVTLQRLTSPETPRELSYQVLNAATDSKGMYRFDSLPGGKYAVLVNTPGWVSRGIESVEAVAGKNTDAPELVMTRGGRVRIQLVDDATGRPIKFEGPTKAYVNPQPRPRTVIYGFTYNVVEFTREGVGEKQVPPGDYAFLVTIPGKESQPGWIAAEFSRAKSEPDFAKIPDYEVVEGEVKEIEVRMVREEEISQAAVTGTLKSGEIESAEKPAVTHVIPATPPAEEERNDAYENGIFTPPNLELMRREQHPELDWNVVPSESIPEVKE